MTTQALSHHLSRFALFFSSPPFLSPSVRAFPRPRHLDFRRTFLHVRPFFSCNSSRLFSVFASSSQGIGVETGSFFFLFLSLLGVSSNRFWECYVNEHLRFVSLLADWTRHRNCKELNWGFVEGF